MEKNKISITISKDTWKLLSKLKINKDLKTLDKTILFLLENKENKRNTTNKTKDNIKVNQEKINKTTDKINNKSNKVDIFN